MSVPQASLGLFGTQATTSQSGGQTGSASGTSGMTTQDFLNLLVTEMQNQDPLNPTDSSSFIQQMSSLTDVSAMGQMTQSVDNLASLMESQSAIALVGKTVTLDSAGANVTGQVTGVQASAGGPEILVGGVYYPLAAVSAVGTQSASSGAAAGTGGNVP